MLDAWHDEIDKNRGSPVATTGRKHLRSAQSMHLACARDVVAWAKQMQLYYQVQELDFYCGLQKSVMFSSASNVCSGFRPLATTPQDLVLYKPCHGLLFSLPWQTFDSSSVPSGTGTTIRSR